MHSPIVSIIIPSFRSGHTIARALRSAAAQTISYEILVIDGGSDDDTAEAIRQCGVIPDVFISEKDNGVYYAINKGLDKARGEWIYILGADDKLASADAISALLKRAPSGSQLLMGDIINVNSIHPGVPGRHRSSLTSGIRWKNTLHQQGVLYHRSLFQSFRFNPEYRILGDYDFHLRLYSESVSWYYAPILLARCDANGLSKKFNASLYREEARIKKRMPWVVRNFVWVKYVMKQLTGLVHK
jgi:putative colanic acid biosynthesis glycosyltransferase